MSRELEFYLEDILEACNKILLYIENMPFELFKQDAKTYDAVLRNLEVVGEAAKQIPDSVRILMPEIEWRKASGLRDMISHAYFGIDDQIVWDVIQNKIPELKEVVTLYLKNSSRKSI